MDIDLNCDLGEGCPYDAELMPLITSANVACGFHAGDAATAHAALRLAAPARRAGRRSPRLRRPRALRPPRIDLHARSRSSRTASTRSARWPGWPAPPGVTLRYVKPHGALYNMACRDDAYARPVVAAAELFGLALMGLPGSRLEALSAGRCPFVAEGFADRRYLPDGSLVPRSRPDAFVEDPAEAVRQAHGCCANAACARSAFTATTRRRWPSSARSARALTRSGFADPGVSTV